MSRLALPLLFLLMAGVAPGQAQAQADADSRLRTIDYDESAVVQLSGCPNFQTMITFGDSEHVENVGLGDSSVWQVTPNKRGNLLFVKPLAAKGFSNMTVVSDKHSYNFELRTATPADCDHGRVVYDLRFRYAPVEQAPSAGPASPADPNAFLPLPEKRNTAYTYSGAVELVPMRIFDDGTSTYMRWGSGVSTPAVYALNSDGTEALVNYAARGDYFVVEQVARAFVMRRGDQKVTVYNDAFRVEGLDALSPKPRGKSGGN